MLAAGAVCLQTDGERALGGRDQQRATSKARPQPEALELRQGLGVGPSFTRHAAWALPHRHRHRCEFPSPDICRDLQAQDTCSSPLLFAARQPAAVSTPCRAAHCPATCRTVAAAQRLRCCISPGRTIERQLIAARRRNAWLPVRAFARCLVGPKPWMDCNLGNDSSWHFTSSAFETFPDPHPTATSRFQTTLDAQLSEVHGRPTC
jgi:hypothetical protein